MAASPALTQPRPRLCRPGFYRVGVTVTNGRFSDLAYRNFRVFDNIPEIGTEGQAADWAFQEVIRREGLWWTAQSYLPVGPAHPAPTARPRSN